MDAINKVPQCKISFHKQEAREQRRGQGGSIKGLYRVQTNNQSQS